MTSLEKGFYLTILQETARKLDVPLSITPASYNEDYIVKIGNFSWHCLSDRNLQEMVCELVKRGMESTK